MKNTQELKETSKIDTKFKEDRLQGIIKREIVALEKVRDSLNYKVLSNEALGEEIKVDVREIEKDIAALDYDKTTLEFKLGKVTKLRETFILRDAKRRKEFYQLRLSDSDASGNDLNSPHIPDLPHPRYFYEFENLPEEQLSNLILRLEAKIKNIEKFVEATKLD